MHGGSGGSSANCCIIYWELHGEASTLNWYIIIMCKYDQLLGNVFEKRTVISIDTPSVWTCESWRNVILFSETCRAILDQGHTSLASAVARTFNQSQATSGFDPRQGTSYQPSRRGGYRGRRGARQAWAREKTQSQQFNVCVLKNVPMPQPITAAIVMGTGTVIFLACVGVRKFSLNKL